MRFPAQCRISPPGAARTCSEVGFFIGCDMLVIKKWNEVFETADTRKRVRLGWYQCPTGVDSAGYIELMSHGEKGLQALGVFSAICQWSATCPPAVRGKLMRSDGRELSMRQLSSILRIPEALVIESVKLLMTEDVRWLIVQKQVNSQHLLEGCHQSAGGVPGVSQPPDTPSDQSASDMPQGKGKGEGQGQGKGTETQGLQGTAPPARACFRKPTVADVAEYATSICADIDPQAFHDHYTSNGWRVGKAAMKDWKAAVRNWAKRDLDGKARSDAAVRAGFTRQAQQDAQWDVFREVDEICAREDERERQRQLRLLAGSPGGSEVAGSDDYEAVLSEGSGPDDPF